MDIGSLPNQSQRRDRLAQIGILLFRDQTSFPEAAGWVSALSRGLQVDRSLILKILKGERNVTDKLEASLVRVLDMEMNRMRQAVPIAAEVAAELEYEHSMRRRLVSVAS